LPEPGTWRRCSACKSPIALGAPYFVCSVSTCNRKRTGLAFCSVSCWEVHLPSARHRESWALERRAPTTPEASDAPAAETRGAGGSAAPAGNSSHAGGGRRRLVRPESTAPARGPEPPREVLVVASRLKEYVRLRSGYNTSDRVMEALSDIVRRAADEAIRNAERDGRRTVLERDVPGSSR